MATKTEIATIQMNEALQLKGSKAFTFFTDPECVKPLVDQIISESSKLVPDLTTKKGRDEIGSNALKVSKSRSMLEDAIDLTIKEAEEKVKKAKIVKKEFVTTPCNEHREALLKPRKEWQEEQARIEANRISKIRAMIQKIENLGQYEAHEDKDSIANKIDAVEAIDVSDGFKELSGEAAAAVKAATKALNDRVFELVEKSRLAEAEEKAREADEKLKKSEQRQKIDAKISNLRNMPMEFFGKSSIEIGKKVDRLSSFEPKESDFLDRTQEAVDAINLVVTQLTSMKDQAVKLEDLEEKAAQEERATLVNHWREMAEYAKSQLVLEDIQDVISSFERSALDYANDYEFNRYYDMARLKERSLKTAQEPKEEIQETIKHEAFGDEESLEDDEIMGLEQTKGRAAPQELEPQPLPLRLKIINEVQGFCYENGLSSVKVEEITQKLNTLFAR